MLQKVERNKIKRCQICKTELNMHPRAPITKQKFCKPCYTEHSRLRALERYYTKTTKLLKLERDIKRIIKQDFLPIIIKGKAV